MEAKLIIITVLFGNHELPRTFSQPLLMLLSPSNSHGTVFPNSFHFSSLLSKLSQSSLLFPVLAPSSFCLFLHQDLIVPYHLSFLLLSVFFSCAQLTEISWIISVRWVSYVIRTIVIKGYREATRRRISCFGAKEKRTGRDILRIF